MPILRLLLTKILKNIPIVILVSFLVFLLFHIVLTNPAAVILGQNATKKEIALLNEQLGLNKPLVNQYLDVLKSLVTFQYGRSWISKQNIVSLISSGLGVSIIVTILCTILSTIVSLGLTFVSFVYNSSILKKYCLMFAL